MQSSKAKEMADVLPMSEELPGWRDAILTVAGHYRLAASSESLRLASAWNDGHDVLMAVRGLARQAGLAVRFIEPDLRELTSLRLPVVVQLRDGQVAVINAITAEQVSLSYSGDKGLDSIISRDELQSAMVCMAIMRPAHSVPDMRVDDYVKPFEANWLRKIILGDLRPYCHIMVASLMVNILALAGLLFSRQVYDRVVPAQSYPTLYVLFGGVLLALFFAFLLRIARMRITDVLGKRADLRMSDLVFGHALRVRNSARPKATGTFIAQLRELEHVRDVMTSTTISAIADMPFFFLFCAIFWYLGGALVWIPLAALVLLIVPGLLAQRRLRELAQADMRESSLRNALLIEAVQGNEDIKSTQSEQRFLNQWNHYNAVSAEVGLKLRSLLNTLNAWVQTVQGSAFAVVVFFGVPMIIDGDMTTGDLVACSILATRMIAPLAGITQVMNRWQQAKVAMESLDGIMSLPVDNPEEEKQIHRPAISGEYELKHSVFSHDGQTPVLQIPSLKIQAGERIAILGRNGAGKSTLLQALSGLMEPVSGTVFIDSINMQHIDPADVRRDIGLLSQNARLFHGTLRENLLLGFPHATDQEVIEALQATGAWSFVRRLPTGLDHLVLEGGGGLSGGQQQSLLLARLLIRQPSVLLLDEPTASLDEVAEKQVVDTLRRLPIDKTVVIATHRMSVLQVVDRILVVSNGRIVLDDEREKALQRLRSPNADAVKKSRTQGQGEAS